MKTKKDKGFAKKIVILSTVQFIIVAAVVIVITCLNMIAGMRAQAINGLESMAQSIQIAFNNLDQGDYYLNDDNQLMKGSLNLNEQGELLDTYAKASEKAISYFYGDVRMMTTILDESTGERIIGTKASEKVVEQVVNGGNEYEDYKLVINNKPYYAYYMPLKNSDGKVIGMLFIGQESSEINAFITEKIKSSIITTLILIVICCIISGFIIKGFTNGLLEVKNILVQLEKGNLNVAINDKIKNFNDEIGGIARATDSVIQRFQSVITSINDTCTTLLSQGGRMEEMAVSSSRNAENINHAVGEIANGASTQAVDVGTATSDVIVMGDLIETITKSINTLYSVTGDVLADELEAADNMVKLSESNGRTTDAIRKVASNIQKTDESVQKIGTALNLITSIAKQTNLLSLNASIEAARAGESGRGFSVVASEISKLAEESSDSAQQIGEIIQSLAENSTTSIQIMDEVRKNVREQEENLSETKEKMERVGEGIKQCNKEAKSIFNEAEECNGARIEIQDIIQNLSALSEENAAASEETMASMNELSNAIEVVADVSKLMQTKAGELSDEVQFFTI